MSHFEQCPRCGYSDGGQSYADFIDRSAKARAAIVELATTTNLSLREIGARQVPPVSAERVRVVLKKHGVNRPSARGGRRKATPQPAEAQTSP